MTDRPILFSGQMVRALLAGTKTQTRRALKFGGEPPVWCGEGLPTNDSKKWAFRYYDKSCDCEEFRFIPDVPRAKVGDRLYVREAWHSIIGFDDRKPRDIPDGTPIFYCAGPHPETGWVWGRSRPSMFMPRWASRLTLIVTDVRVQRLQEISEEDAIAEGLTFHSGLWLCDGNHADRTPRGAYSSLWEEINGEREGGRYAWGANPWVTATSFTVEHRNIDEAAA